MNLFIESILYAQTSLVQSVVDMSYNLLYNNSNKSSPKVIWEERVTTRCDREWNRPLRVLRAAQYPLQTKPITQPRVRYIHTERPHASYTLHCVTALSDHLPQTLP